MRKNVQDILASYIDALFPIIYINHFDFRVIDGIIAEIRDDRNVIEFNNGLGEVRFEGKAPLDCAYSLTDFLNLHKDDGYESPTIMILKDIHGQMSSPEVISILKYIAERNLHVEKYSQTVFVVSSKLIIPIELENYITVCDFPLPDIHEIEEIICAFAQDFAVTLDDKTKKELAISFKGLSEFQIIQILNVAYQDGGEINSDDKELILHEKEQLIKKSGILETININEGIKDIGGLEKLKDWLYKKACIFNNLDEASEFGVDTPKGIMILGMPGCGKSLAAKATARLFNVPLVRLDIGRLMGKYVGESEENLRRALKLAEAISPCVLWIDEIEKAFSGIGGTGGGNDVTTRLFGQFLTWMQEKENTVFIVATANDISKIPPEFLRKGRFDELFFVDFPNELERKKIIEIHLKKRDVWNDDLDLSLIAEKTVGYNGADLEAVVKDAIERCFIRYYENRKSNEQKNLRTEDLEESVKIIESISKTLGNRIDQIKSAVEDLSLKPASCTDVNFVAEECKCEDCNNNEKDVEVVKCDTTTDISYYLTACCNKNCLEVIRKSVRSEVETRIEHNFRKVNANNPNKIKLRQSELYDIAIISMGKTAWHARSEIKKKYGINICENFETMIPFIINRPVDKQTAKEIKQMLCESYEAIVDIAPTGTFDQCRYDVRLCSAGRHRDWTASRLKKLLDIKYMAAYEKLGKLPLIVAENVSIERAAEIQRLMCEQPYSTAVVEVNRRT